jgi:hypothetical protein
MSRIPLRSPVTEEFLAFSAEKAADGGNGVIALLEDKPAGNQTSSPLVVFRAALAAISSNVFLRVFVLTSRYHLYRRSMDCED